MLWVAGHDLLQKRMKDAIMSAAARARIAGGQRRRCATNEDRTEEEEGPQEEINGARLPKDYVRHRT
jgi:hypothetical protein